MKRIPLTKGLFTLVDDSDYKWLNHWKWCATKIRTGAYYAVRKGKNKRLVYMHREIMDLLALCGHDVDHINGDSLDNRRENLRPVTRSQNTLNSKHKKPTIGIRQVKNGRWRADIRVEGARLYLGYFDTKEEAALAYNTAALQYHGEFARLNDLPINPTPKSLGYVQLPNGLWVNPVLAEKTSDSRRKEKP